MYVRRTEAELNPERVSRKGKSKIAVMVAVLVFVLVIIDFKTHGHGQSWDAVFAKGLLWAVLFSGLAYFVIRRNYDLIGGYTNSSNDLVCLKCGKVFMQSQNSALGLLAFGKKKKKWWQIQPCDTPESCDIARLTEVKWIDDNEKTGAESNKR